MLNLVYRDQLFPREVYRLAFERLLEHTSARQACKTMVGLLSLAHERACEAELAARLHADLAKGKLPELKQMQSVFQPDTATLPDVVVELQPLSDYNGLLHGNALVTSVTEERT